jgi:hypothetical protein
VANATHGLEDDARLAASEQWPLTRTFTVAVSDVKAKKQVDSPVTEGPA